MHAPSCVDAAAVVLLQAVSSVLELLRVAVEGLGLRQARQSPARE